MKFKAKFVLYLIIIFFSFEKNFCLILTNQCSKKRNWIHYLLKKENITRTKNPFFFFLFEIKKSTISYTRNEQENMMNFW